MVMALSSVGLEDKKYQKVVYRKQALCMVELQSILERELLSLCADRTLLL